MKPPDPTVTQLIAAFREKSLVLKRQAKAFDDRANNLEADLHMYGITANGIANSSGRSEGPVDAAMVRKAVQEHGGRIKNIAKLLNTHENLIAAIVKNPDNGIYDKGRGWLAVREEDSAEQGNQPAEEATV